ncbi:MAG: hypothetical protein Q6356_004480 [Candidatus Wukongarchaeota archaeon]|nr:hypothetical protein [Candidatus Wukongarchaeota archaeon]
MEPKKTRVYVLVELQPGKEREFAEEILSRGMILDPKVERLDFVHGSFDFITMLYGTLEDVDRRIIEMRKSPYVRKTQTLICFEMFSWEEMAKRVSEEENS